MLLWILLGLLIYLAIGIALFIWVVVTDDYGGFIIGFAVPFILFYPFIIVTSIFSGTYQKLISIFKR